MAAGDKVFIADKATLDAAKTAIDTVNTKVGVTGDTGGSATAGSIFAKLNALITSFASHVASWTAARAANLDEKVSSRQSEADAASRYNTLINQVANVLAATASTPKAYMSHVTLATGTITILNLTGKGVFYGAFAPMFIASYCSSLIVTIDGTEYSVTPMSGREYLCRSFDGGAYPLSTAAYSHASMAAPVPFKQSFKIVATFTQNSDANACRLIYDLYE